MDSSVDYWQVPAATAPNGTTSNLINPPSIGYRQTATNIVVLVIMIVIVMLRLYTRAFIVKSIGYDDCKSWPSSLFLHAVPAVNDILPCAIDQHLDLSKCIN